METIKFEEECEYLEEALRKQMRILEGQPEKFTASELTNLYTITYNMFNQNNPRYNSIVDVYDIYKRFCDEYIDSSVLPSLREQHDDELVLHEIVKTWTNYKLMVRWLMKVFNYLDRWLQSPRSIGPLKVVGYRRFEKRVCGQIGDKVKDAVVALVTRERQGEHIDRTLAKNLIEVYVEIDTETKSAIVEYKDFENYIEDSGIYYWRKALVWFMENSFPKYMVKVEKALTEEKGRVSHYRFSDNLNASSEAKLLERVKKEMLVVPGTKLFDDEQYGCRALLRQDRKDDLARMFRLYRNVPQALEHVAALFNEHVAALFNEHVAHEGIALVQLAKQAEAAAGSGGNREGGEPGLEYVEKLYALHVQYKGYVVHCWENHELFQNALKEAFEVFCNTSIAEFSSAELLATFCDSVLNKIGELTIDD